MKALIFNNKAIQLEESEFPVSPEHTWMDAPDGCKNGWTLVDGVLVAPPAPPAPPAPLELTYAEKRKAEYPPIEDQLDALYHAGVFPANMAARIKETKDKYPK